MRLCVMHNLYFYNNLLQRIRDSIDNDTFDDFYNKYVDFMYRHGRYALIIFIGLNYVIQLVSGYSLFGMVNDLSQLIFNKLWGLILGVSI